MSEKEKEDILEGLREIKEALRETRISIERLIEGKKDIDRKIKELAESQRKTDEQMKETDKKIRDLMENQKKTDEQMKETDRKMRETDKQLKETDKKIKELVKSQEETGKMIKELMERQKKTDYQIKALTRAISELNGTWKRFSEKIIFDNIENTLNALGFKDFSVRRNVKSTINSKHMEIDILAVGEDYVLVMEVKTTLKVEHVKRFVKKLKDKFLSFFPEFKGRYKVYGVVIGINLQEGVDEFAIKNGLLVFRYKDKSEVEVLNPERFKPKDFSTL